MKLLTVAIPAYNAERYLDDCLDSVFNQGIREEELEVIVINDASKDGTLAIARRWAKQHSSIRVIDQESHGIAYNRNLALELATGKYFVFLDADDIVSTGAYRRLIDGLEESGSDFVTSPVYRFADWQKKAWLFTRNADLFEATLTGVNFADRPEFVRDFMVWNKIFRKAFLDQAGIPFPEGMIYEDVAVMPKLFAHASRFDVVSFPVVYWRITDGSITQTLRPAKALDRLKVLKNLQDYFSDGSFTTATVGEFDFAILDYNLRWIFQEYYRYDDETQREIIERARVLIAPIQEAIIERTPEPLRSWTKLLRAGEDQQLTDILDGRPQIANLPVGVSDDVVRRAADEQAKKEISERRRAVFENWKRRIKHVLIYLVFRPLVFILPVDKKRVFVANYWGNKFSLSDGPAAIAVRLSHERPDMKITVLSSRGNHGQIAENAASLLRSGTRVSVVKNQTFRYYYHLWRAKYLFNDVNFAIGFNVNRFTDKRSGQIEVQTTHGTPLKKMGIDSTAAISAEEMPKFLAKSKRYDYLVAPSEEVGRIFAASHAVEPVILETGLPQNDSLFEPITNDEIVGIKTKYGLDRTRKLVVYSPTYRYDPGTAFPYSLDFARLAEEFGEEYQFAVKIHPFAHTKLAHLYFRDFTDWSDRTRGEPFVKLFGTVREEDPYVPVEGPGAPSSSAQVDHQVPADINELMRAADILITDYSSILFNYPHLRKPMITYAPDFELYEDNRGTYFTLSEITPGAFTRSTEEVIHAIRLAESPVEWAREYEAKERVFSDKFHRWERGNAASKILRELDLIN